ncbi:MAG: DNA polymerase III subunit beta [Thermodesulfobacteriota bacterium]
MKIKIGRKELKGKLPMLKKVAGSKASLSILTHSLLEVKDDGIFIIATNLETGMCIKLRNVEVHEKGQVVLDHAMLLKIATNVNSEYLEVETGDDCAHVHAGTYKAKMPINFTPEDFPKMPDMPEDCMKPILKSEFLEAVGKVMHALPSDAYYANVRFNGVYVGKDVVAMDGHRMAVVRKDFGLGNILVPKDFMDNLQWLEDEEGDEIKVTVNKGTIVFECGDIILFGRLIEGEYPDYESIVSDETTKTVVFERRELARTIKMLKAVGSFSRIVIEFGDGDMGSVNIRSFDNSGVGTNEIPVTYIGNESLAIAFNGKYLLDMLNVGNGKEEFVVKMSDNRSVVIVEEEDAVFCIMPMSL